MLKGNQIQQVHTLICLSFEANCSFQEGAGARESEQAERAASRAELQARALPPEPPVGVGGLESRAAAAARAAVVRTGTKRSGPGASFPVIVATDDNWAFVRFFFGKKNTKLKWLLYYDEGQS